MKLIQEHFFFFWEKGKEMLLSWETIQTKGDCFLPFLVMYFKFNFTHALDKSHLIGVCKY